MITINGGYGEGGGQILRTSLSLSAITGKPFVIAPLRPDREKPGLLPQHLAACLAVAEITQGALTGANLGSQSLSFIPKQIQAGEYQFNIGTAGAIILLSQTVLPILLFAKSPSKVTITGGTHVKNSPGFDYFEKVFLHALQLFGISVTSQLLKIGYYPKGGGKITLEITPQKIYGFKLKEQSKQISAIIRLSRLVDHIALREKNILQQHNIDTITILENNDSLSSGNAVTLYQGCKGSYALGQIGKRAEAVAEEAWVNFNKEKLEVDEHLADQIVLYAALAEGESTFSTSHVSEHLKTNIYIIKQFIKRSITVNKNNIHVAVD